MAENRDNTRNLSLNKPGLFSPTVVRGIRQGASHQSINFSPQDDQLADSSIQNTGSYKYSVDGTGLRSTQQLNIGWSEFENHTFFNSAQVKTNVAFEKIFNEFPFDGSKQEFENFFSGLTGYEKWVYDQFPKNLGYMFFSGAQESEDGSGTYITVKDVAGSAFPTVSTLRTGETVINPADSSMTIEFWMYLPAQENSGSSIFSKVTGSQGFIVAVEPSANAITGSASGSVSMYVASGALSTSASLTVAKGAWNHVAFTWDRSLGVQKILGYLNQEFINSSSQGIEFDTLTTQAANLYIGSGSQLSTTVTGVFNPTSTFSGALDEVRIWHSVRSIDQLKLSAKKAIFAQDDLKLYYKLNEASGSNSLVVLDHSSNSVHGRLNNNGFLLGVRNVATGNIAGPSPMTYEKIADSPVLFPTQPDLIDLRTEILISASRYDLDNPNLITKLVPVHYFLEGQAEDGLSSQEGDITTILESGTDPRSVNLGGTQALLLLLYTWAKFFDEMKLYVQAFSTLNAVDYNSIDTVPDQFLLTLARNQGIELPPLFDGSSIEQFLEGENIQSDISTNDLTLQGVRNQIWRRILINLQDVLRSKGTMHSVKSFIRSVGIDPDNNFRIREYGGPNKLPLNFTREKRNEVSTLIDFVSGGLVKTSGLYLTSARTEPGYPTPSSTNDDFSLLSGSFTFSGYWKMSNPLTNSTQSLARLHEFDGTSYRVPLNVTSISGSGKIRLAHDYQVTGDDHTFELDGPDIYDGGLWFVSFGRRRNDDGLNSRVSSSYFLRAAKAVYGEIVESYSTASFVDDHTGGTGAQLFESYIPDLAASADGMFFAVGSSSLAAANLTQEIDRTQVFDGKSGHWKLWSKYINENEWKEHARNFRSVGVTNPATNFNFVTTNSGSWERLRFDFSTDQPVTASDGSGVIALTNFAQNTITASGSNFPTNRSVAVAERFYYSSPSPKFDQAATTEKVRVRSFQNFENVQDTPWAQVAPVYEIVRSESPTDNTRFTVDFSVVDALDQDIITLFANLQSFDNSIGSPELAFSPDYPDLESLRDAYFNKLVDKMNLKLFFEFYKWFDTNIGTFIEQLIPRKTKFLGTNFVVESHMLERPKVEYLYSDIYLGDNTRHSLKDTILLQLITGTFSRY